MFFGAGVGAYAAAIFLLVTHAFFKALLFLAAGSVMHGNQDRTDMLTFGGLRRSMPATAYTWVFGWLAMAGLWPFAGFFSKDQVIAAASQTGRTGLWIAILVASLLTSLYISRGTFLTFFGPPRTEGHPHDAPPLMRIVLVVLAGGSLVGGFLLGASASSGRLARFIEPVVGAFREPMGGPTELVLSLISVAVALAGIGVAYFFYLSGEVDWQAIRVRLDAPKRALQHGFYVNDLYNAGLVATGQAAAAFVAYVFDARVVDGAVNGMAVLFALGARSGRRIQTGLVRNYALSLLVGAVGILLYLAVRF
jgi:NADH-quinone oxidoreductase subunit L